MCTEVPLVGLRRWTIVVSQVACCLFFFFSSRRRHTRWTGDWSSDVCSSDLPAGRLRSGGPAPDRCHRQQLRRLAGAREIGRASCRERVEISGGAGSLKKKKKRQEERCEDKTSRRSTADGGGVAQGRGGKRGT